MKATILMISFFAILLGNDLASIRVAYKSAVISQKSAQQFSQKLQGINHDDSYVLQAYKGASLTLLAKHEKEPKIKIAKFKEGIALVENAIAEDPKNLEIRLIRLTIQQNSPRILKYNTDITADKKLLTTTFKNVKSPELKVFIQEYFLESDFFSEEEKQVFAP